MQQILKKMAKENKFEVCLTTEAHSHKRPYKIMYDLIYKGEVFYVHKDIDNKGYNVSHETGLLASSTKSRTYWDTPIAAEAQMRANIDKAVKQGTWGAVLTHAKKVREAVNTLETITHLKLFNQL